MALLQGDEEIGSPFGLLRKVAASAAKTAGGIIPGPYGVALKTAGNIIGPRGSSAPPPPCTFGQKVKRFFGSKQNCT